MSPNTHCAYCGRPGRELTNSVRMGVWDAMAFMHWSGFRTLRQERKEQHNLA
jgi:hypothetical protein